MAISAFQLDPQGTLLPNDQHRLLIEPFFLPRYQLPVKAMKNARDKGSHLSVGEILTNAVTGAEAEGLDHEAIVVGIFGII